MGIRQQKTSNIKIKSTGSSVPKSMPITAQEPINYGENRIVKGIRKVFADNSTQDSKGGKFKNMALGRKEMDLLEKTIMAEVLPEILPDASQLPKFRGADTFQLVPKAPLHETMDFLPFAPSVKNNNSWWHVWDSPSGAFHPAGNDRVYSFLWELQDRNGVSYLDVEGSFVASRDHEAKEIVLQGFRFQARELGTGTIPKEETRILREKTTQGMNSNLEKVLKLVPIPQPLPESLTEALDNKYGKVSAKKSKNEHGRNAKVKKDDRGNREIQLKMKQNTNKLIAQLEKLPKTPECYMLHHVTNYNGQQLTGDVDLLVTGNNNFSLRMQVTRRSDSNGTKHKDNGVKHMELEIQGIDDKLVNRPGAGNMDGRDRAKIVLENSGNIYYSAAQDPRMNLLMRSFVADLYNLDRKPENFIGNMKKVFNL